MEPFTFMVKFVKHIMFRFVVILAGQDESDEHVELRTAQIVVFPVEIVPFEFEVEFPLDPGLVVVLEGKETMVAFEVEVFVDDVEFEIVAVLLEAE